MYAGTLLEKNERVEHLAVKARDVLHLEVGRVCLKRHKAVRVVVHDLEDLGLVRLDVLAVNSLR